MNKLPVRCTKCDREMSHYNTFTSAINEETNVCWECTDRDEKGFNTKRDWRRSPRQRA
jgi:DNA-directed RNA polymerase subunit N (RpoN/RPB10)